MTKRLVKIGASSYYLDDSDVEDISSAEILGVSLGQRNDLVAHEGRSYRNPADSKVYTVINGALVEVAAEAAGGSSVTHITFDPDVGNTAMAVPTTDLTVVTIKNGTTAILDLPPIASMTLGQRLQFILGETLTANVELRCVSQDNEGYGYREFAMDGSNATAKPFGIEQYWYIIRFLSGALPGVRVDMTVADTFAGKRYTACVFNMDAGDTATFTQT